MSTSEKGSTESTTELAPGDITDLVVVLTQLDKGRVQVEASKALHECVEAAMLHDKKGGNITLKMLEGVSETVTSLARYAYRSRFTWKIALMLLSGGIKRLKELTDWQQYGGAPILGFDQLCIKAHGRSGPRAIRNAIRVAERCIEQGLAPRIRADMEILGRTGDLASGDVQEP